MTKSKQQTQWEIRGFDGMEKFFEVRVPVGCFTEIQMQELLKTLAAKAGLSYKEIVGAYAKRKTRLANDLLNVRSEKPKSQIMCGSNPHFIARIVKGCSNSQSSE